MQHITNSEITELPSQYRASLINSLSGFKSANLIGTINDDGKTNLAIFSSVFHIGACPPLVGFIMRPDSVERHTLMNIKQQKNYTINQVAANFWKQAHQSSARYSASQCEFKETGLTPQYLKEIPAPFVAESMVKYAVELKQILPIDLNQTMVVIGEITDIFYPKEQLRPDGYIDIESLGSVTVSGLNSYHKTESLGRLNYAKPGILPSWVD